jgi:hypothetical protein
MKGESVGLCIRLSLLGNNSVKTFPRQQWVVRGVVLYEVHAVSKEIRRLILSRTSYNHSSLQNLNGTPAGNHWYNGSIIPEGLRINTKNFSRNSRCSGGISNLAPPEYKFGALLQRQPPRCSCILSRETALLRARAMESQKWEKMMSQIVGNSASDLESAWLRSTSATGREQIPRLHNARCMSVLVKRKMWNELFITNSESFSDILCEV